MKDLPNVRLFLRLMVDPGWAPICVVVLFLLSVEEGVAGRFDHLTHGSGGAAIAFFFWRSFGLVPYLARGMSDLVRYLFAFTSACAVAVFWELAEFFADRWLGTALQHSVEESMLDLLSGVVGAAVVLILVGVVSVFLKRGK